MALRIPHSAYKTYALNCPVCGWTGSGQDAILNYESVMDLECPKCFKMLAIIDFPTYGEVLYKGSEADRKALLRDINFQERFKQLSLKSADQLPDIKGPNLKFTFRSATVNGDDFNIIEYKGQRVWQEPMLFEGYKRFMEVGNLLKEKYGSQMIDLIPDPTAELYLYGDKLTAPAIIAAYREELNNEGSNRLNLA